VGLGTVGILSHYEETKNRSVRFHDIAVTQNQLLAIAKKAAPEKKWAPVPTSTADMLNAANAALAKGDHSVMYEYSRCPLKGRSPLSGVSRVIFLCRHL
jgi:hypothetical protein